MFILWSIALYFSFAVVDVLDKFLLSTRKIVPAAYAFFTVVTGGLLLVIWPFVYEPLAGKGVLLNLLCGAFFALLMYVFFKVLSFGEASRVIPFIFALVPIFDLAYSLIFKTNALIDRELWAILFLIPGAFLIAYAPGKNNYSHIFLKILCAFLFSSYNYFWQFTAQNGSMLNHMMWNRLGGAAIFIFLLILPSVRKKIFDFKKRENKANTSILFLVKQALGGLNFILLSALLVVGKISIVDGLSVFRYAFVFAFALILSHFHSHILKEEYNRKVIMQKVFALALIITGTFIFFL